MSISTACRGAGRSAPLAVDVYKSPPRNIVLMHGRLPSHRKEDILRYKILAVNGGINGVVIDEARGVLGD